MKRKGERVGGLNLSPDALADESDRIASRLSMLPELSEPAKVKDQQILPLDLIMPDPVQPRRPMPDLLRLEWCQGTPLHTLFEEWEAEVIRQVKQPIDWKVWIEGGEVEALASPYPAVQLWVELIRLAGNIHQYGLERPITVFPVGETYQVITGERRLLSYHLLDWMRYPGYRMIPAIVRESYNPYQQAVENGVRENLNAIGVTRQLALLLMALNNWTIQASGQMGQAWYAQAGDLRVPYGKADQVALMLGLPNEESIRRYRALLQLPSVVWNWADEFNWTERKLRELSQKAKGDETLLVRLAQSEVNRELGELPAPVSARDRVVSRTQQAITVLKRTTTMKDDELRLMGPDVRRQLVEACRDLLNRLDNL
jgi:ParB-like chromosome segregation protein Spo0J